ncbi:MAG: hypothetical protein DCC65_00795 [Planctomycetota bacterium]|nr:MAG: hypothetical protein DCC65_00795 [Planctomycetota bacterium]
MKLTEHLTPALIKVPLAAADKTGVITELVELVAGAGLTSSRDRLLQAVLDRESQRSTGIGRGFAIPHAKCDAVDRLVVAIGRCREPIDFKAIDGQPVTLLALLASPISATSAHIQALAKLSRLVTNPGILGQLLEAQSADDLYRVVVSHDSDS